MLSLIKYGFLAWGRGLWLVGSFIVVTLISHIFPLRPGGVWLYALQGIGLLWTPVIIIILFLIAFERTSRLLDLFYQQVPLGPGKLIASHLVVTLTLTLALIASQASFYPFAAALMPNGLTLLMAANIFSYGLYFTGISLVTLSVVLPAALFRDNLRDAGLGLTVALVVIYLLFFQVDLNPVGLITEPLAYIFDGTIAAGGLLLQARWETALRNIALIFAALLLQSTCLAYLLNKTDF